MTDINLAEYLLHYRGDNTSHESFLELLYYLTIETAIGVTVIYTVAGLLMFIMNRRWKFIYLPFLYAAIGVIAGIVNGFILCIIFYMHFI